MPKTTLSIPAILSVCLLACLAHGETSASQSAGAPRVLYVLDASGSMRGKVGTEEKMTAARRVLRRGVPIHDVGLCFQARQQLETRDESSLARATRSVLVCRHE